MNVAVRRLDRQDRLKGDREPVVHNQQLKTSVRCSANLRPIELMAVGLAAAQGAIGRAQSVVPVVCRGLDRERHRQDNQAAPIGERSSRSPQNHAGPATSATHVPALMPNGRHRAEIHPYSLRERFRGGYPTQCRILSAEAPPCISSRARLAPRDRCRRPLVNSRCSREVAMSRPQADRAPREEKV